MEILKKHILNSVNTRLTDIFKTDKYHIISIVVTGSTAYEINSENSDIDIIGIYIPPVDVLLDINNKHKPIVFDKKIYGFEGTLYPFSLWYDLLVKQNPVHQEILWTDSKYYVYTDNLYFNMLFNYRINFLSRKLYYSYTGVVKSNIVKLTDVNKNFLPSVGYNTKLAVNILRLLDMCDFSLNNNSLYVSVPQKDRDFYKSIRSGQLSYESYMTLLFSRRQTVNKSYTSSILPEMLPDECYHGLKLKILKLFIKEILM